MRYVYMLESLSSPERHYVGCTSDLKKRFADHNDRHSPHTSKFGPWKLRSYVAFADHDAANRFERYLKTGSGRAFAKRHF